MWASQARVKPLVVVAAYGDQQQQRSYRPGGGGGGRGGSGGGRGGGGGRYGQRDRRNQSWDRRKDKRDDTDTGYTFNKDNDARPNSGYDPRNDSLFTSRDDGDAGSFDTSWDGGYSAGRSSSNERRQSSRSYDDSNSRERKEDSFSFSREGRGGGGGGRGRGGGGYGASGRGERRGGRGGGGSSSSYGSRGGGRGGDRFNDRNDRYNNNSRDATTNYNSYGRRGTEGGSTRAGSFSSEFSPSYSGSGGTGRSTSQYSNTSSYDNDDDDGFNYERGNNSYDRGSSSGSSGFGSSIKDLWEADVVFGVSPVLAALEAGRRTIHTLYVQEGVDESKRKDKGAVVSAMEKAKQLGAVVKTASKHDLNMVSDNRPHQGLILDATALDFEHLDAMPAASDVWDETERNQGKTPPVWLCLDEVVDPQNFGAALRSAFFLGATGVLTCKRNSAPLSPVVSKASAGALELMPVHSCRNLPQTLADAKSKGWTVIGAAAQSDAVSCSMYKLQGPTILVMGNEGYGLRTTVRQQCDVMLRIDGNGTGSGGSGSAAAMGLGIGVGEERMKKLTGLVDSLNVSVATGILMHQLLAPKSD